MGGSKAEKVVFAGSYSEEEGWLQKKMQGGKNDSSFLYPIVSRIREIALGLEV